MYDFKKVEEKWQKYWEENNSFKAVDDYSKKKYYNLVEFPYPSGSGMHLGHIKAYLGLEVLSRKRRMEGYNVLFPIGFDAFGLPTENYAIKMGIHPRKVTDDNIKVFLNQLKRVGFSFDYSRVVDTTDPAYFKWTQWIFLKLFENNLAYKDKTMVNFCPDCNVVLSNEESQGGKCDRCGHDVIQKIKDVWFLKITDYAEKLLEGLESVDYLPRIKKEQENWIGKSKGAYINFKIKDSEELLKVYTTRPDTTFGVTFMVMAPEHPLLETLKEKIENLDEIKKYQEEALRKNEFERTQLVKDKTGVLVKGITVINPINNEEIPLYIADYVMMGYGTGAIMAVPAHDTRDYDFAKEFNIKIIPVIEGGDIEKEAYTGEGKCINSGFLNGITTKKEAISKMINYLEENNIGSSAIQYKMKDWPFNRQRYWGEPIPIIHCDKCGMVPVPYEELPLKLPELETFKPGENGESPLADVEEWVNVKCPKCGQMAKRETDTMPQWAGSSWYFLRYIDPFNNEELASKEKLNYWKEVDWYNGGMEHVTRHLLYSRFWHRFLYDIGVVPTKEPYRKRTNQGLILGSDGEKMSKSRGNTIDPNDIVDEYGADVLRTYVLFMGEYSDEAPWNENGVKGISRFLDKIYRLKDKVTKEKNISSDLEVIINKTIKKVSEDIEHMKYNTAISELMVLTSTYSKCESITLGDMEILLKLLNPFAPHLGEELWEKLGFNGDLVKESWPISDDSKIIEDNINIAVSINGKPRATITIKKDEEEESIKEKALKEEKILKLLENKEILKIIVVPNKIVNIVIKN